MDKAKEYFKNHPKVDKFYKTKDDLFFFTEQDAKNHADSLVDKEVICVDKQHVIDTIAIEEEVKEVIPLPEEDKEVVPVKKRKE